MATFGAIRDNISTRLHRQSISSVVESAILRAVQHYQDERFWFNEGRISFTVSTGALQYTLSNSTGALIATTVTRNGSTYEINPIPEAERMAYDTNSITGDPTWYARHGDRWIPYPQPNQTYTVHMACVRHEPTLSASTDTNAWTTHAEELIEARAAWYVATYQYRDVETGVVFKGLEKDALNNLRSKEAMRATNRVRPTTF